MEPLPPVTVLDRASVSVVREQVRAAARAAGFPVVEVETLALVASELAQNQLDHARAGEVTVTRVDRGGVPGVSIRARDRGEGLPSPAAALSGAVEPRGLGAGLPTVHHLAGEVDLDVRYGEGTTLTVRRFLRPVARHPSVAVLGRGVERPSGDVAFVRRDPHGLLLAVIDGVGHGGSARAAADLAVAALASSAGEDVAELLGAIDSACRGSRGVAATIARWDVSAGTLVAAGVGNVVLRVFEPGGAVHGHQPTPGVLGVRAPRLGPPRALRAGAGAMVVAHTDGIATFGALPPATQVQPPWFAASELFSVHGKAHDDRLVLVAR